MKKKKEKFNPAAKMQLRNVGSGRWLAGLPVSQGYHARLVRLVNP